MNRKISIGGAITLAIMFSTVTFIMTMIYAMSDFTGMMFDIGQRKNMYSKLHEVDLYARTNFINEIDEQKLMDNILRGYVKGLDDPYAFYFTTEQYAETMSGFEGKTVDIGLECSVDVSGYLKVEKVTKDSPAELAGIERGDLIIKVDELAVTAEHAEAAADALRGEPGTTVTVLVRRGTTEKTYSITRRRVEVLSAEGSVIDGIGYIKIKEFNDNTPEQFKRALNIVNTADVKGIVFDLRNNPGGTMESVAQILDILLPKGPIVSSTDKAGVTQVLYNSDASEVTLPMTVLINNKSASAAELFAQALKDYDKAKIVGTTSYGKGTMQNIYPLKDGSALDITVAFYNPPFSPNFNGIGVKPDYEVKLAPELEQNLDSLDISADVQLKKAIEVIIGIAANNAPTVDPASSTSSEESEDESASVADKHQE